MKKTNAIRQLEKLGLSYTLKAYAINMDEHLSAEEVADAVGLEPQSVFKTLLAKGDLGLCFGVVPAHKCLNLKQLAKASGNRKVSLVPLRQLRALTGYVRGGVTAIAAKKACPTFLDCSAETQEIIAVSAGVKGMQVLLRPPDFLRAANARLADLAS